MEKEISVSTWEELEEKINELKETSAKENEGKPKTGRELLFRGQGDHSWALETTLYRAVKKPYRIFDFFRFILKAKPQIQTFTGQRWGLGDFENLDELERWCQDYDRLRNKPIPGYEYLIFLRHHGFPSPLLDWTRSFYIAAFFAFIQPPPKSERIAIYAYKECGLYGKGHSSNEPQTISFGPFVTSHPRHYIQQSQYTIAVDFKDGHSLFVNHEEIFKMGIRGQDYLWKYTLPCTERQKVLRILDEHNLNDFSLFQSEEALLKTIAVRELEL